MKLSERLDELVRACFTGIWIESHEHDDALAEIKQLCSDNEWRFASWDIDRGLKLPGNVCPDEAGGADPLAAIRSMAAFGNDETASIVVLTNFHRFLGLG